MYANLPYEDEIENDIESYAQQLENLSCTIPVLG